MEKLSKDAEKNTVIACTAFLKMYMLESGRYEQFIKLEYYEQKVKKMLE